MNKNLVKVLMAGVIATTMMTGVASAGTLPAGTFKRLAGNDRIETAIAISKEKNQIGGTVVITNAYNFADALAGSTLCYQENKATVLLTEQATIDNRVLFELDARKPSKIIILGGNGAVSANIEKELNSKYGNIQRISGQDRYATAVAIGQKIIDKSHPDTVFIAYGDNYPDALAASTFAATKGYPILFTGKDTLNTSTQSALSTWGVKNVVILGGQGVISANVEQQLSNTGLSVTRIGGANRYDTAKLMLDKYYDSTYSGLTICYGEDFPDALAGASLASEMNAPVMLYSSQANSNVEDYIRNRNDRGYVIGGVGVLPEIKMKNLQKGATTVPTDSKGTLILANGDKYEGELENGIPNGQGTLTYTNGDKYVGEFKEGMPNGQGTCTSADGNKYVGEFKAGIPNGKGTFTLANGDKYEGEVKDGEPNGQGTCTLVNGNKYIGEFKDGMPNGQGTCISANGDKYVGQIKDGKMNGQGTYTWVNGDKYVGEFKDGLPNGQGTLTSAKGDKYVGEFKNGKMDGQGTLTLANGQVIKGTWKDNKYIGN